ncbi:response regulator transcription factor [Pseudochelatococcus sp. B33]
MTLVANVAADHAEAGRQVDLAQIIQDIGEEEFFSSLFNALNKLLGVDYLACYRHSDHQLQEISSETTASALIPRPIMCQLQNVRRYLMQADQLPRFAVVNLLAAETVKGFTPPSFSEVLIFTKRGAERFCIRVLRHNRRPPLSRSLLGEMEERFSILLTMLAKHINLARQKTDLTPALASGKMIEDCLLNATDLSRRESEVCSRILLGATTCEIAEELGIGKESVMTYRKRAYRRLSISSQRELLVWYIEVWTNWSAEQTLQRRTCRRFASH